MANHTTENGNRTIDELCRVAMLTIANIPFRGSYCPCCKSELEDDEPYTSICTRCGYGRDQDIT